MLRVRTAFLTALITLFVLWLVSLAHATRSRLSGMGDLSIVIEDESNMLNLWDFAGNPAGFLEDEQGHTVRTDLALDTYQVKWVSRTGEQLDAYHRYKPSGHYFRTLTSASLRRKDKFAVALNGNYVYRRTEYRTALDELEYPVVGLVFSMRVHSNASVGGALSFVEYESAWGAKEPRDPSVFKTKHFTGEIGAARRIAEGITLGALVGLDHADCDKYGFRPDFYTYWMSLQCMVDVQDKVQLGLESALNLGTADFSNASSGDEEYYFTYFRLRGVWDLTSKFRVGLLFAHNELFNDSKYPLEFLGHDTPLDGETVAHWGAGCSYKLWKNTLFGLEYHFKNSSKFSGPSLIYSSLGLMLWSVNVGLETKLSPSLSLRAGYMRVGTTRNPPDLARVQDKANENALSLGVGYQLGGSDMLLELSYSYAYKRFELWYRDWDVDTPRHCLSLSVKIVL